jgi:hypothetical protein
MSARVANCQDTRQPFGACQPVPADTTYKRKAPAAWVAAGRATAYFKPGWSGLTLCGATKRDGTPCGRLPVKGSTACYVHGGAFVRWKRLSTIPRCEAVTTNGTQCVHAALEGPKWKHRTPNPEGLCPRHANRGAAGKRVTRVDAGQRVRYRPAPVTRGSAPANARTYMRGTPPPELRATQAWQRATRHADKATLMRAWEQRESSPALWREAVRDMLAGGEVKHDGG